MAIAGYTNDGAVVVWDRSGVRAVSNGQVRWSHDSPIENAVAVLSPNRTVVAIADGRLHLVHASNGQTATLALVSANDKRMLAPHGATTAAGVMAVLGKSGGAPAP